MFKKIMVLFSALGLAIGGALMATPAQASATSICSDIGGGYQVDYGTSVWKNMAILAYRGNWRGDNLVTAVAIAHPESRRCTQARNYRPGKEDSRGLWQINLINGTPSGCGSNMYDPQQNATCANVLFKAAGKKFNGPWKNVYNSGAYVQYLDEARAGYNACKSAGICT